MIRAAVSAAAAVGTDIGLTDDRQVSDILQILAGCIGAIVGGAGAGQNFTVMSSDR